MSIPPRRPLAGASALLAWTEIALKSFEIAAASSQVVPIRLARMAAAGPNPTPKDRREMHRMGAEKVAAFSKSGMALAAGSMPIVTRAAMQSFETGFAFWANCMRMALPTLPPHRSTMTPRTPDARSTARLINAALKPVHATVTANARRLTSRG